MSIPTKLNINAIEDGSIPLSKLESVPETSDTWRPINVDDTSIGDNNPLNLKSGDNVTISKDDNGNVTINATMPSIDGGEMNVQSNWTETDSSKDSYIQNKPNLATVATSGSYNDLSNTPTIPTVNNGTLKITQNGIEVGTFTANQSGNTTIELTDTNTDTQSDWDETDTASAAYIKNKPNLATVATSGSYNDLSNKPTITVVNIITTNMITNVWNEVWN